MLHHVTLWVPSLERAEPSWRWLLGELGYELERSSEALLLFRHPSGVAVVLEESPDMVPGMLFSRLRPGMNHLAFALPDSAELDKLLEVAPDHGWSPLAADRHPIAGGADVGYLEDRDGFEVELVTTP